MVGEIEMASHEGICKYCGSMQPILAADQTDANIKVSEHCECKGYIKEKQHDRMIANIDQTFGPGCLKYGLQQVSNEQMFAITYTAEQVFDDVIGHASIGLFGSAAKISRTSKGGIKIERTFATKVQTEA